MLIIEVYAGQRIMKLQLHFVEELASAAFMLYLCGSFNNNCKSTLADSAVAEKCGIY